MNKSNITEATISTNNFFRSLLVLYFLILSVENSLLFIHYNKSSYCKKKEQPSSSDGCS